MLHVISPTLTLGCQGQDLRLFGYLAAPRMVLCIKKVFIILCFKEFINVISQNRRHAVLNYNRGETSLRKRGLTIYFGLTKWEGMAGKSEQVNVK